MIVQIIWDLKWLIAHLTAYIYLNYILICAPVAIQILYRISSKLKTNISLDIFLGHRRSINKYSGTKTLGKHGSWYDMVQPVGNKKVGCFVILVPLPVHGDVVGSATILVFIPMSSPC